MPKQLNLKNHHLEKQLFLNRVLGLVLLLIALSLGLLARLVYLQVDQHQRYTTLSTKNLLSIIPIAPRRGLIYDRNHVLLAKNIPAYSLALIPDQVHHFNATIKALNTIIPVSNTDIKQYQHSLYQHHAFEAVTLHDKLTPLQVAEFYVNQYRFPGAVIKAHLIRQYPLAAVTGAAVGYVGRINSAELQQLNPSNYSATNYIGKAGIEKSYEQQLHGSVGVEEAEINASGKIVRSLNRIAPTAGATLYLTIDSKLQALAEKDLGADSGAVVAIQPATGQILAFVTHPSFNPNLFVTGLSTKAYHTLLKQRQHPLYNRALRGLYAAGSTIKPFFGLAGLNDGVISTHYKIFDPGWFKLPHNNHIYHDWKYNGHGWVNLSKAIMVSCDTYFYNLAVKMGIKRLDTVLQQFGFGHKTGIDLTTEVNGLVPSPQWKMTHQGQPWYTGDTIVTGIGQGYLLTTPLQLAVATATLANRGVHIQPHLLLKAVLPNGKTIKPVIKKSRVPIKAAWQWETVINAMQAVITNPLGTGEHFGRHPPYTVAAKTGTAQVYGHQRNEYRTLTNIPKRLRNNHLFIAFAPVNHPKIAIAVVVEHDAKAVFVARSLLDYYLSGKSINKGV